MCTRLQGLVALMIFLLLRNVLSNKLLLSKKTFLFYVYLLLAALGLRCCTRAFSTCGEQGLLFVVVRRLLVAVASRFRARALGTRASVVVALKLWLSSCG